MDDIVNKMEAIISGRGSTRGYGMTCLWLGVLLSLATRGKLVLPLVGRRRHCVRSAIVCRLGSENHVDCPQLVSRRQCVFSDVNHTVIVYTVSVESVYGCNFASNVASESLH